MNLVLKIPQFEFGDAIAPASSVCAAVIRPRQPNREIAPRLTEFISESARVDLDAMPKGIFGGRFAAVGVKTVQVASIADRVDRLAKGGDPSGQNGEVGAC